MLVVADSSPLVALVTIECISVLPVLFGEIIIPPEVKAELIAPKRAREVRKFFAAKPTWLIERTPLKVDSIPFLHAGELAAISLAREFNADLLLIDELAGRKAAADRNLRLPVQLEFLSWRQQKS